MTSRGAGGTRRENAANAELESAVAMVWEWTEGRPARERRDALAREEPLEIRVRGRGVAVTMRTPGHDEELAAGFLLTEGIIRSPADIVGMAPCRRGENGWLGNVLNVFLAPSVEVSFDRLSRHLFASSSCGICGKASIDSIHAQFPPIAETARPRIAARTIFKLPGRLRAAQKTFDATGGLHAAALFNARGRLLAAREDVGRHNAVDKVVGRCFLDGELPGDDRVLLVSGRASFEILQKALAGRIPVVCAVSAPSSLAVDFARASGQTLAGFLRGGRMNLYSHPGRVKGCR